LYATVAVAAPAATRINGRRGRNISPIDASSYAPLLGPRSPGPYGAAGRASSSPGDEAGQLPLLGAITLAGRYARIEHAFGAGPKYGAERSTIMGEQLVGTVTHYFGQPHVAIVEVSDGVLHVGDTIRIAGVHSDFTQKIQSMELEHASVESANVGDSVGVQVSERAREHDRVYLLTGD
jgi:hypothetical protein